MAWLLSDGSIKCWCASSKRGSLSWLVSTWTGWVLGVPAQDENTVTVIQKDGRLTLEFDKAFSPTATQEQVFAEVRAGSAQRAALSKAPTSAFG